jgi:hypothetical protein
MPTPARKVKQRIFSLVYTQYLYHKNALYHKVKRARGSVFEVVAGVCSFPPVRAMADRGCNGSCKLITATVRLSEIAVSVKIPDCLTCFANKVVWSCEDNKVIPLCDEMFAILAESRPAEDVVAAARLANKSGQAPLFQVAKEVLQRRRANAASIHACDTAAVRYDPPDTGKSSALRVAKSSLVSDMLTGDSVVVTDAIEELD